MTCLPWEHSKICCHAWFLQTLTEQNMQGLNGTGLMWKILWKWKTPKCYNTCGSSGLSTRGLKVTKYLHKKEKINDKVSPTLSSFWVRARTWLSMLTYMRQCQTTLTCEICVRTLIQGTSGNLFHSTLLATKVTSVLKS